MSKLNFRDKVCICLLGIALFVFIFWCGTGKGLGEEWILAALNSIADIAFPLPNGQKHYIRWIVLDYPFLSFYTLAIILLFSRGWLAALRDGVYVKYNWLNYNLFRWVMRLLGVVTATVAVGYIAYLMWMPGHEFRSFDAQGQTVKSSLPPKQYAESLMQKSDTELKGSDSPEYTALRRRIESIVSDLRSKLGDNRGDSISAESQSLVSDLEQSLAILRKAQFIDSIERRMVVPAILAISLGFLSACFLLNLPRPENLPVPKADSPSATPWMKPFLSTDTARRYKFPSGVFVIEHSPDTEGQPILHPDNKLPHLKGEKADWYIFVVNGRVPVQEKRNTTIDAFSAEFTARVRVGKAEGADGQKLSLALINDLPSIQKEIDDKITDEFIKLISENNDFKGMKNTLDWLINPRASENNEPGKPQNNEQAGSSERRSGNEQTQIMRQTELTGVTDVFTNLISGNPNVVTVNPNIVTIQQILNNLIHQPPVYLDYGLLEKWDIKRQELTQKLQVARTNIVVQGTSDKTGSIFDLFEVTYILNEFTLTSRTESALDKTRQALQQGYEELRKRREAELAHLTATAKAIEEIITTQTTRGLEVFSAEEESRQKARDTIIEALKAFAEITKTIRYDLTPEFLTQYAQDLFQKLFLAGPLSPMQVQDTMKPILAESSDVNDWQSRTEQIMREELGKGGREVEILDRILDRLSTYRRISNLELNGEFHRFKVGDEHQSDQSVLAIVERFIRYLTLKEYRVMP